MLPTGPAAAKHTKPSPPHKYTAGQHIPGYPWLPGTTELVVQSGIRVTCFRCWRYRGGPTSPAPRHRLPKPNHACSADTGGGASNASCGQTPCENRRRKPTAATAASCRWSYRAPGCALKPTRKPTGKQQMPPRHRNAPVAPQSGRQARCSGEQANACHVSRRSVSGAHGCSAGQRPGACSDRKYWCSISDSLRPDSRRLLKE